MDQMPVGLRSAIRALSKVVEPAVDASHAQARDQLRLVVEYLEFVAQRLDHVHELTDFEFRHNLSMAKRLREIIAHSHPASCDAVTASIERAEQFSPASDRPLQAIREATASLALAVSEIVREAPGFDGETRRDVERCVLNLSADRIAFERSWYLPLGLDTAPNEVTPLSRLLQFNPC